MGLAEPIEQSDSEEVNDNKNVRVSRVKSRKTITATINAISMCRRLLTVSIQMILPGNKQNVRVKNV